MGPSCVSGVDPPLGHPWPGQWTHGREPGGAAGRSASPTVSIDSQVAIAPDRLSAPSNVPHAHLPMRTIVRTVRGARLTEWYHEDDDCWVAECEACYVPMVVWKRHDPNPPEEIRVVLHHCLQTSPVACSRAGTGSTITCAAFRSTTTLTRGRDPGSSVTYWGRARTTMRPALLVMTTPLCRRNVRLLGGC